MSQTNYFSHCTTWSLLDIDKDACGELSYIWRCSTCGWIHSTTKHKNNWLHCPMCGFKISTSVASTPIDRIYNTLINAKVKVPKIVVDWNKTESTVYICHNYDIKPNGTFMYKHEEMKIENCVEFTAFKPPRGLANYVEFKIIHVDRLPPKAEDETKRFIFLDPVAYPRYTDEIPENWEKHKKEHKL